APSCRLTAAKQPHCTRSNNAAPMKGCPHGCRRCSWARSTMIKVEHPNGIDVFEFPDDASAEQIRAAFDEFDTRRNRQAAEISQYHQLRDEVLRIQKSYSEEIAAVRHEIALARQEAERAREDAAQADALRHDAEERAQGFPQRENLTEE